MITIHIPETQCFQDVIKQLKIVQSCYIRQSITGEKGTIYHLEGNLYRLEKIEDWTAYLVPAFTD